MWSCGCTFTEALEKLAEHLKLAPGADRRSKKNGNGKPKIVKIYDYRDADGNLLFQTVRYEPKDFKQRQSKEGGGWTWNLKGVDRVLYRLPELLADDLEQWTFATAGEKDTDRLRSEELSAMCGPMGEGPGKWKASYSDTLAGRKVAILVDNDDTGHQHVAKVAKSLAEKAALVKVIELPRLPEGGDVSDWLDAGGTADELLAIVDATAEWKPKKRSTKPTSQSTWSEEQRTETANARRLAATHGDKIRWCEPWGKMLLWDGKRWRIDSERRADALAKKVAAELWDDVTAAEADKAPEKIIGDLIRFARASNSANGIANMLRLVRSEPGIAVLPDVLDQDPWLLNVENGTLDLRTGKLRLHRQDDFLTKLAPVRFDADADCPIWLKFIDSIFGGNKLLIGFVRRLAGYCLTGSTRDHVLPFLYGKGANGKSVLINTLLEVSGPDYAMKAPTDFLTMKRGEAHPTERADLHGKRLVAAIEAEEGRRLAEAMVKELTGGDKVRARRMRENFWEFTATHKVMLASNHKPTIRGTDDGIWRRILLIPFTVRFWDESRGETGPPELEADKELAEKLLTEKSGILNWLLWGCIDWQANGLMAPDEVLIETDKYRTEMDIVGRFIEEHCVESAEAEATAKDLYARFQEWCKETGEFAIKQRQFGTRLTERGYERFKNNGARYRGVGLITGF